MMRAFSLADAVAWTGGQCRFGDAVQRTFSGVSTDTRKIGRGDLFVALRGDNFDGHQFLAKARESGAVGAIVDTEDTSVDLPQMVVSDTVDALAQLAAGNRNESQARFVAITGSSGKTTVREMVASILTQMGSTLSTEGNLNNHIGVPLTLFRLEKGHRFAAIELGASGLGEIAHTVAITRPDVAILTNAGQAHLEGFGSYENIVQAKGEIIDGVGANGLVVLNGDDPAFGIWRQRAGGRKVTAVSGKAGGPADYYPSAVSVDIHGQSFIAHGPDDWQCSVQLALSGEHNITNALLAIAATRELGATHEAIQQGLQALAAVKGRLQMIELSAELVLIDDSYNANPSSMKAAIGVLAARPGIRAAVLGAMAELGPDSRALHREVGVCAREQGVERLLVVGPGCEGYIEGFGQSAEVCASHEDAVDRLLAGPQFPMTILVKGSRSSAMDRVVEGMKEKVNNSCCSG
ncbi:UDP-N-acetylmuramoyl-tripeptide--D-alanyl-D-alanine ligase [Marinobacter lipolyticus SM19]|uniref:UDP-N-acetylmuramoyl-tripeptide--D-alanyl-D-alanine ligase n=1 Tax=Marinobacter lipolyticus SM19 TaxID=1318628 RepID=R8AYB0_9GAMM|nr:UDP-N-acetylmuramoyl-tripeptide--D-alanyl-D-alanine ligase [Marinobacter lipolyticus]EON91350.1 UDP-N-acetylmuramoyl-tripeptide--D-alanyl-D-alanine ligase [Marinobacter lipolyticus SM19]